MNSVMLPTKLGKEPLVDVVFEVRFTAKVAPATVLPGLLFSNLTDIGQIEPLPVAQLPEAMRLMNPQLAFAAVNRITWKSFVILIGDRSLAVGCKMPYPGWSKFKAAILEVMDAVKNAGILTRVQRHSLKYMDFLESGTDHKEALNRLNVSVRIGNHEVTAENTSLRVELPRGQFLHAIQMASLVVIQQDGIPPRSGALVSVDTLVNEDCDPNDFFGSLSDRLESLHLANKEVFFECLSEYGLNLLEPIYE